MGYTRACASTVSSVARDRSHGAGRTEKPVSGELYLSLPPDGARVVQQVTLRRGETKDTMLLLPVLILVRGVLGVQVINLKLGNCCCTLFKLRAPVDR